MNLKKYAICACALASTSAFATQYLYNGGDANSASGYLEITDGTIPFIATSAEIHLYPDGYTGEDYTGGYGYAKYKQATSTPSETDTIHFLGYRDATDSTVKYDPNVITVKNSLSFKDGSVRNNGGTWNSVFQLGSADATESTFTFKTSGLFYIGFSSTKFQIASDAAQTSFNLEIGVLETKRAGYNKNNTITLGEANRGFDSIVIGTFKGNEYFPITAYTKQFTINGNAKIPCCADIDSALKIFVTGVEKGKAAFTVYGELTLTEGKKIELDFSNVALSDFAEGGDFILAQFNTSQTLGDYTDIFGDSLSTSLNGVLGKDNYSLKWRDNILTLNVAAVPEPATVAAILGAVAIAFAAYRRRR